MSECNVDLVIIPEEINITVEPTIIKLQVADPTLIGEAGATIVSSFVNSNDQLELVMSDGRHVITTGYVFR